MPEKLTSFMLSICMAFGLILTITVVTSYAASNPESAAFSPTPTGTVQIWKNLDTGETGRSVIGAADGYRVKWTFDGNEREGYFACAHCTGNAPATEDDYAALWPLETGKKVSFYRKRGSQSWANKIEVIGTETIMLEELGDVHTYVLKNTSNRIGGSWRGEQTVHYAPALGWIVRFDYSDNEGVKSQWELVSQTPP